MGDRGNIEISQPGATDSVFLYTHWGGSHVCEILASAIVKGRNGDPSYFTRIVFDEMVNGDRGTTGFGISVGNIEDNEYDVPVVSWNKTDGRMVIVYRDTVFRPEAFVAMYASKELASTEPLLQEERLLQDSQCRPDVLI